MKSQAVFHDGTLSAVKAAKGNTELFWCLFWERLNCMIGKNDDRIGSEGIMAVNGLNFEKPDELWLEEVKAQTKQQR